jgi:hypothetical protein
MIATQQLVGAVPLIRPWFLRPWGGAPAGAGGIGPTIPLLGQLQCGQGGAGHVGRARHHHRGVGCGTLPRSVGRAGLSAGCRTYVLDYVENHPLVFVCVSSFCSRFEGSRRPGPPEASGLCSTDSGWGLRVVR